MHFDRFRQDLTGAVRQLLRGRLVSVIAVLSLAIGIAANTTVFSLVQALMFPRLIYPGASRLVFLESRNDARGISEMLLSEPDARDLAAGSRTLQGISLSASQSSILRVGDAATRVQGRRVEPGFFELLQVPPARGRVFSGDDASGIILSDALWRSHFGADPAVIGAPIRLDGGVVTAIGVMPPLFDGDADFWTPLGRSIAGSSRDDRQFEVMARIAPGLSLRTVRAELDTMSARMAAAHPATNLNWRLYATPLARLHGRDEAQAFLLLQAAVAFVLLIACANIANLLLARGVERRREMAVRLALGAGRRRLVVSLLVEAIVLAGTGGAGGVLLSMWSIRVARTIGGFPDVIEPHLNLWVLGFTIAITFATGVLCGLLPALRASAVAPEPVLRDSGRGATDRTAGRLGGALVVAQIAGALMLATCAALLLRSFANRERVALGFEPRGAFRADVALADDRYTDPARIDMAAATVLASLSQSPNVVAAGARTWALPTGAGAQRPFTLPDARDAALPPGVRRGVDAVTPAYFTAVGAALIQGRAFNDADRVGSAPVAIVNEELARRLWPHGAAIGRPLRLGTAADGGPVVTVVGVVTSMRRSPMHETPTAMAYLPFAQYPNAHFTVVTRTRGDAAGAARALTAALHAVEPDLIAENVRTLEDDVAQFMTPLRLVMTMLSGFAAAAVLLAGLGVFGTMSYNVVQRYHEIAVRSALGADRTAILRLVFGAALRLTLIGVAIGTLLSALAARTLRIYLFGVTPTDPSTYLTLAVALPLLALAACWRPARAAASVDPMRLLRL